MFVYSFYCTPLWSQIMPSPTSFVNSLFLFLPLHVLNLSTVHNPQWFSASLSYLSAILSSILSLSSSCCHSKLHVCVFSFSCTSSSRHKYPVYNVWKIRGNDFFGYCFNSSKKSFETENRYSTTSTSFVTKWSLWLSVFRIMKTIRKRMNTKLETFLHWKCSTYLINFLTFTSFARRTL